ncbi:hypothetical protein M1N79_03385 [Dehalococcoidia bacterium]|nr:hypothetical protein [Dehalococcoidia bacterium]
MIRLEEVTKVFPDGTEAIREATFEVEQGEKCLCRDTCRKCPRDHP